MTESMPTYFFWIFIAVSGKAQNHECKSTEEKLFPPTFQYSYEEKEIQNSHLAFLKYCLWVHTSPVPDLEGIRNSCAAVAKGEQ